VDLLPTFCEIAGAELPGDLQADGVSQVAVLTGKPAPLRKKTLYWKKHSAGGRGLGAIGEYAILEGKWKLLADNLSKKVELYDVSQDPLEKADLSSQRPERVGELLQKLKTWKNTLPKHVDASLKSKLRGAAK
jgi:arylsulfatase A-like enzyme